MEHNLAQPSRDAMNTATLPPVDVPQNEWRIHPILQRARLNVVGDGIEWPNATFEQLPFLREITLVADDGVLCARLAAQFNFDQFVDASTNENAPAQPPGHAQDCQRFYTRVTENGFHVVGVFSATTMGGRRRYFQWLTGAWVEIGLNGFIYVRDDLDTHFSEVSAEQLDGPQPGASASPVTVEEQWTTESVQNQFVGKPMVENEIKPPTAPPSPMQPVAPVVEAPVAEIPVAETPLVQAPVVQAPVVQAPLAPAPEVVQPPEVVQSPEIGQASDIMQASDVAPIAVSISGEFAEQVDAYAAVQRSIAIAIASIVHRDDLDFAGAAAIDHVARVAESFDPVSNIVQHCAAWLHDVLEVSTIGERDLLDAGVSSQIVEVVTLLTRRDGVDEEVWLDAIFHNPDARAVKMRALADNSAAWRLRRLDAETRSRVEASCERMATRLQDTTGI